MPAAPDPFESARAQAGLNKETAIAQTLLNQIDSIGPYGSVRFEQIPGTGGGNVYTGQPWAMPTGEGATQAGPIQMPAPQPPASPTPYEQWQANTFNTLYGTRGNPTPYGGLSAGKPAAETATTPSVYGSDIPRFRQVTELDPAQQRLLDQRNQIGTSANDQIIAALSRSGGPIDTSGLPKLLTQLNYGMLPQGVGNVEAKPIQYNVGANDFSADRRRVEDALYSSSARYLDPQYEQEQRRLETQLINQGFTRGTEAYQNELDRFAQRRDSAYADARDRAILAGGGEQSRLFGLDLSKGQFYNQAQGQDFSQGLSNAQLVNALRGQMTQEQVTDAAIRSQARNQLFGENQAQLNTLFGLQGNPTIPTAAGGGSAGISAPNLQQAIQNQYNAQVNAANQASANQTSTINSIFGLAGSVLPFLI